MQLHKSLAKGAKSGKAFAIMDSEQATPRRCGKEKKAGDASTAAVRMSRRQATEPLKCCPQGQA
jgi:hypothetical protein